MQSLAVVRLSENQNDAIPSHFHMLTSRTAPLLALKQLLWSQDFPGLRDFGPYLQEEFERRIGTGEPSIKGGRQISRARKNSILSVK